MLQQYLPFTVLKLLRIHSVAVTAGKLQQCLPFTVLKLTSNSHVVLTLDIMLQQCLPFTVLKLCTRYKTKTFYKSVATVLIVTICATGCEVEAAQRNDEILYIAVIYTD